MMLYDILIAYLRIFSLPRYQSHTSVPDGSDVLDCLAYGFSKLVEEIKDGDDILLNDDTLKLLDDLDARLSQVAYSSKRWRSSQEWESVQMFAWKVIESMGLNTEDGSASGGAINFLDIVTTQEPSDETPENGSCGGTIYERSAVDRPAIISSPPKLELPVGVKKIEGRVILNAVLCHTGKVTDVEVVESLPYGITERAVEAVLRAKFIPATKEGQNVSQRIRFELNIEVY